MPVNNTGCNEWCSAELHRLNAFFSILNFHSSIHSFIHKRYGPVRRATLNYDDYDEHKDIIKRRQR